MIVPEDVERKLKAIAGYKGIPHDFFLRALVNEEYERLLATINPHIVDRELAIRFLAAWNNQREGISYLAGVRDTSVA